MKERRFLRNLLVTLLALALSVTFTYSDFTVVKADTTPGLLQYDSIWKIFKYFDNEGTPQFTVNYFGQDSKELGEDTILQYRIINKDYYSVNDITWEDFDNSNIKNALSEYSNSTALLIQFSVLELTYNGGHYKDEAANYSYIETARSNIFPLYNLDNNTVYISDVNIGYFETYDVSKSGNTLNLQIRFNEKLEKSEDAAIQVSSLYSEVSEYAKSHPAQNISIQNYEQVRNVNGQTYEWEYSILSFDIEILPSTPKYHGIMEYKFAFSGFETLSGKKPDKLQLFVDTPMEKSDSNIYVKSINVTSPSNSIKVGNSINLVANVMPSNATNKSITWSSSNTDYATVDQNGKVTTKTAGAGKSVAITAKAKDGSNVIGTYTINIEKVPEKPTEVTKKVIKVTKIKLKASAKKVKVGKKVTIKAIVTPQNASNKKVKWSVNKKKYAKINSKGVLTTKKAGKGKTVTVTAKAGGKKATIKIKIKK